MRSAPRAAILAAVFLSASSAAFADGGARAAEPDGYLVAPFANESKVKALDWMSSALAFVVAEKLEALPQLRPAYGASILEGWTARFDASRAAQRARDAGARWVVTGAYARPNWKAAVKVRLYELVGGPGAETPSLRLVAEAEQVGDRNALLAVLGQALDALLDKQKWTPTSTEATTALRRQPTRDLYAFTLFGRALNFFYGLESAQSLEQAQKILTRTTVIDPKFAEARRMRGLVDLARGEPGKAAGQYAYALELKPGYYACIVGLARLYRAENKKQPAREMADKALGLRPSDTEMRLLVGTLEWENGELDKALADLLKVTAAVPRNLQARRTLAQIRAARGEVDELAAELERVAELQPDDLEVRLDLGSSYMRIGKNEQAIAAYEEVLKKQPRHVQALKFTGDLYRRMGDPDRAVAVYERMRHLVPEDPRAYFLLGAAYAEAGQEAKATQVLQDAQQFHAYVGEAWSNLGALALRRGDLNRAGLYLSRAVTRSPMRPKAHFNYALLLEATKQNDKALAELKTAAELDPEDPECHYLAGVIHLRDGQFEEAKAEFVEALRLRPGHPDAKHNLALLEDLERRYTSEHGGQGAR